MIYERNHTARILDDVLIDFNNMHFLLHAFLLMGVAALALLREREDDELIALAQSGDHDAFHVLVERHHQWLLRLLRHLLPNAHDAEDMAQSVFLRAFVSLPKFRQETTLRGWLRTIATRQCFDLHRYKHSKGRELRVDVGSELPQQASPFLEQEGAELIEAIHLTLDDLPFIYREVLVLRYLEELDLQEIAKTLRLGDSAAKMRLKRAREMFEQAYHTRTHEGAP